MTLEESDEKQPCTKQVPNAPEMMEIFSESNDMVKKSRKYGTATSKYQYQYGGDRSSDQCTMNRLENEATHDSPTPSDGGSSASEPTDSATAAPPRFTLGCSYNEETVSLQSQSLEEKEAESLIPDSSVPPVKILKSSSQSSSLNANRNGTETQPKNHQVQEPKFVPPDGGYGWVVVAASCLANVWIVGLLRSYSILYVKIMQEYGSSAYQASWIHALLTTTGFLLGPVTGLLCRKYGSRRVSVAGAFLAFSGVFLSSFCSSVTALIFTLGLLAGFGVGFVTTPGILVVNLYFDKHRGIASAICMSGNAIGAFLMPPLLQYLLLEYGLRGTLLITSALQLNILVSASLFRPTDVHAHIQDLDRKRAIRSARDKAELPLTNNDLTKVWSKLGLQTADCQPSCPGFGSIDPALPVGQDSLTQELSSYRSLPLMTSLPNLKEFRDSFINKSESRAEIQNAANSAEQNEGLHHIASSDQFVRPARKRSLSECQYPDRDPALDPLNVRHLETLNVSFEESPDAEMVPHSSLPQNNESRSRKISLRRYVIDSSVRSKNENAINEDVEQSMTGVVDSGYTEGSIRKPIEGCERLIRIENGDVKEPFIGTPENSHEVPKNRIKEEVKLFAKSVSDCFDVEVLKTRSMIIMSLAASMYSMGVPQALFYLHVFYTSVGMSYTEVTSLLSITAIFDLCGRLSMGFLADLNLVKMSYLIAGCTALASAGALSVPSTATLATAAVALSCYSFGVGAFIVLLPTILARNHGTDRLPATYGFSRLGMGLTTFIAPQLIGALVDATGSYMPSYYLMGSCMMVGAVLLLFMPSPPDS